MMNNIFNFKQPIKMFGFLSGSYNPDANKGTFEYIFRSYMRVFNVLYGSLNTILDVI